MKIQLTEEEMRNTYEGIVRAACSKLSYEGVSNYFYPDLDGSSVVKFLDPEYFCKILIDYVNRCVVLTPMV